MSVTGRKQLLGSRTEHEIVVAGLKADRRYAYAVGDSQGMRAGPGADFTFQTVAPAGTVKPTRIWVLGDSGTANDDAVAVTDAYLALAVANVRPTFG